ncbi:replication restart DNA helicase PriA [Lutibacter oricola]|uniref:Replication restart protein PriA n=1 Tax=Lutibacter oricola TaxID=762486 RepID=A0A1H2XQV1_9FLAO|nr:primosomal protein N' [Lutibacter oricola]SDW95170.1 replication restart DNA helicase PriA [Lutibacter oricola]
MNTKGHFINVILPIPLQKLFTYRITEAEAQFLKPGIRVAVEFGKSKIYTALVYKIHNEAPVGYDAKDIHQILDEKPIVNEFQLKHWDWISGYYMCSLGEVFRAAMPSAFMLESESIIQLVENNIDENELNNDEFLIFEALENHQQLTVQQIVEILNKKTVLPVLKTLIDKEVIVIKEQIYEQYKPKLIKYVRINEAWSSENKLPELLELLSRAKKQRELILAYFQLNSLKKPIKSTELIDKAGCTPAVLKALVDKEYLEIYYLQKDRINFEGKTKNILELSSYQETAFLEIKECFKTNFTTLLKGVTSSGKTEIYVKLIKEILKEGKQVLYLLPEIALTTQLIDRLQVYFGDYLSVFHSKYSINERVEVWNNVLDNKPKARLILGARSSIFLPYSNLGLIIVDEEHETSFKQFDPSPRYHARDASIVLANHHKAKVLLGSATPSVESFHNAKQGKYGYVELNRRYNDVMLPEIELVDIKEKYKKKRMSGHFSDRLLELIAEALEEKEQVILFQNRRGYSPVLECETCGVSPQCPNCDVSLTYHNYKKELRCHYCGHKQALMYNCGACGSEKLNTKGFGTEQIETEIDALFPKANVGRMDLDTTRGKFGYQKIIGQFQAQEIDILVGTQMLSKGLDFSNVTLVGVMNADNMLNFPDFRAHERSYQLMVQVAGRAGRFKKRGKVAIQTFNPYHQILQQVSINDYDTMFKEQLDERWQYHYPPFYRLIKITLRHKDFNRVEMAANWLGQSLTNSFKQNVLGPTAPSISRIRNYYIRTLIIKIPHNQSIGGTKQQIRRIINSFQAVKEFRSVRLGIDVDNFN